MVAMPKSTMLHVPHQPRFFEVFLYSSPFHLLFIDNDVGRMQVTVNKDMRAIIKSWQMKVGYAMQQGRAVIDRDSRQISLDRSSYSRSVDLICDPFYCRSA